MLTPSAFTRKKFREFLVATTLGYIGDVFDDAGLEPVDVPPEKLPSGMRRSLVEQYYAGVDWGSPGYVGKVLRAYEQIMADSALESRKDLAAQLRRDGFNVDDETGRISYGVSLTEIVIDVTALGDADAFASIERRMLESIESDPELAIGSAKELVEAASKALLDEAGVTIDKGWTLPQLFKQAAKTLDLTVDDVADGKAGSDEIRKILASLNQVVVGLAELRNQYGTGHGRHRKSSGLSARHARLAVGSSLTLVHFLLETRGQRSSATTGDVQARV